MCQIIHRPPFIIHHYLSLSSTNDQLKQMAEAPEFTCVVADEQTAGRGRRTRTWLSTPGDGLYLSVLLRPTCASQKIPLLSLMAAIAVAETAAKYVAASLDIKWPNDVLAGERKLSGILVEGASAGASAPRIILGIGVNLNHASFPPELHDAATSLRLESGRPVNPAEFRDELLAALARWYGRMRGENESAIVHRWQELSSYARGKQIVVTLDDEQLIGETAGLTETGSLRVRTPDGSIRVILAGEVSRLRKSDE